MSWRLVKTEEGFQPRTFTYGTLHSISAVEEDQSREKKICGKAELKQSDILTNKNIEEHIEYKLRFKPAARLYHISIADRKDIQKR